ncbi:hypothetical protein CCP1ISM_5030002 [Azospirillaceae bacterium]
MILILFGAGRLPTVMGDLAKGVKAFRAGLKDDEKPAEPTAVQPSIEARPVAHPAPSVGIHQSTPPAA